jgi:DNA repair exonuclease SbcCD nuclease subunit
VIRVLLLADTHLGFDLPARPRVKKRRRGSDFFVNTRLALEPALRGEADLVVHGGDLLYRSKVPSWLVEQALEPLLEVADAGVPVVLVPGNHERSALPYPLLAAHENLHLLDRPRTVAIDVHETRVAVGGFPCERDGIRDRFEALVSECGVLAADSGIRLLCIHQTVEGARVKGHTFRHGADIVRGSDIPSGIAAVLCGHIHRSQVLTRDLGGQLLAAPVFYPGSIERTSLAESEEPKGFLILELETSTGDGRVARWVFHELPARPMCTIALDVANLSPTELESKIRESFAGLAEDSVVTLRVSGVLEAGSEEVIRASTLRRLHPPTMSVTLRYVGRPAYLTSFRREAGKVR